MNSCKILILYFFIPLSCFSSRLNIPVDTIIRRAPVIIEGKVIEVTPAYWTVQTKTSFGSAPYRSYIVQVYKVFKGKLTRKYIEIPIEGGQIDGITLSVSDGVSMPGKGSTGIFYLSYPRDSDWVTQFCNSGDTLAKHHVMNIYSDAYNYDAMWSKPQFFLENIERNLYRHIEQITGVKRKVVSLPPIEDSAILKWLNATHQEKAIGREGLDFSILHPLVTNDKKELTFLLKAKSLANYTDLNSVKIVMHYNSKMFGCYIVKKNKLKWGNSNIPNYKDTQLPTDGSYSQIGYDMKVDDVDSSSFSITLNRQSGATGFIQIKNTILSKFNLTIKNSDTQTGLYFVTTKCAANYFDYNEKSVIKPYAYIYCNQNGNIPLSYLYFPGIHKISPDTVKCGYDTLYIRGEYFLSNSTQIKFSNTQENRPWDHFCPIDKSNIISMTDTLIKIIVPCQVKAEYSYSPYLPTESAFKITKDVNLAYPCSGKIKYLINEMK